MFDAKDLLMSFCFFLLALIQLDSNSSSVSSRLMIISDERNKIIRQYDHRRSTTVYKLTMNDT